MLTYTLPVLQKVCVQKEICAAKVLLKVKSIYKIEEYEILSVVTEIAAYCWRYILWPEEMFSDDMNTYKVQEIATATVKSITSKDLYECFQKL